MDRDFHQAMQKTAEPFRKAVTKEMEEKFGFLIDAARQEKTMSAKDLLNAAEAYHKNTLRVLKGDRSEWAKTLRKADNAFLRYLRLVHAGVPIPEALKDVS